MNLSGSGLFVFSDPGGAKAVLALAKSLENVLTANKIISDRYYEFLAEFGLKIDISSKNPFGELKSFNPDFVFTGTSYASRLELDYISAAKKIGIPVYSFVDHWTSFKTRFLRGSDIIFPDKIYVIDSKAKSLAMEEGIIQDKIEILNNPYYSYLKDWYPCVSRETFLSSLGINNFQKKIVIFAPEPLSNVSGRSRFGFDEVEAFEELNKILEKELLNIHLLFKPHPNQNIDRIRHFLNPKITLLSSNVDVNTLIFYSDLVIGFFSNFLIEANALGKMVIRFHLKKALIDPIGHLDLGEIVDTNGLRSLLCQS